MNKVTTSIFAQCTCTSYETNASHIFILPLRCVSNLPFSVISISIKVPTISSFTATLALIVKVSFEVSSPKKSNNIYIFIFQNDFFFHVLSIIEVLFHINNNSCVGRDLVLNWLGKEKFAVNTGMTSTCMYVHSIEKKPNNDLQTPIHPLVLHCLFYLVLRADR